ncbi:MAG: hypothetical protein IT378_25595, partial [Sandaracinaceae bacterium]|nr:hypothetical protein [Sandaracinaceae bacterium]
AAQAAIAALVPAKIGFSYDGAFDMEDRVNRDRRDANDELAGGREDDHHLYVIRVDALDDTPLALVPIFGMHGTLQDADNPIVTTDSTGGLERVLEEEFDREVLVMHMQGAGGDVSPAGSGAIDCGGLRLCTDFAKEETIGWYGRDAILAAYASAGTAMQTELEIEMLTRTIPLGPDWTNFRVRGGALEYAPWDGRRVCDGEVFDGNGDLLSPIDEFNAPYGAALCDGALTALRSQAQMPGTRNLMGYPYRGCNRLEGVLGLFETVLNLELGEPPVCETTRTVVSALRLGDRMLVTLPGEPVTLLSAHLRSLSPMPPERTIVVGYAQDHQGYLLRPEDWLSGGYEPQITFWGPLAGELIVEQAAALMPLAMTPVRENGNEGGVERIATPTIRDDFGPDSAPLAGTIPATVPDRLVARLYQPITSAQPPASAPRLTNVLFTWIGEDPITGTPRAHIERESETSPGTGEPLRRRSGRLVEDADVILTWTPQPINGDPQTHYWTVEWQVAAPLGMPGFASPAARAGLPLGRYKIVVQGSGYTVESDPFDVTPGALELRSTVMGSDLVIEVGYHAPEGYRLLDLQAGANRFVPVRGASVEVVLTPGGAQTLATDASGRVTLAGAATGVTRVQVTDPYGNTGSLDL